MEQSKEQLAEQIYQKYFPTSNGKPFGMYEKKSVLAAIVEAMDSLPAKKLKELNSYLLSGLDIRVGSPQHKIIQDLVEDYVASNSNTDDTSLVSHSCTDSSSIEQMKLMSLEEILKIRNQLPDDWKWHKCYELAYISSRTGREFVKKHWALTSPDNKGCVHSLGLISHDNTSTRKEFIQNDLPVQFVEKSLLIIDSLLSLLNNKQNV